MATKKKKIVIKDWSKGTDLSRGDKSLTPGKNIEARNMIYNLEGGCLTARQYEDIGIDWGEDDKGIDGAFIMDAFPDVLWVAVNGKIKYADISVNPQSSATVYEADTGLSLTAGNAMIWAEYRNTLYFGNGVNNLGRLAVARLDTQLETSDGTAELEDGQGFNFTNGSDKFYVEGDEVDYTAVSSAGVGDDLTTCTNIGATHAAGAYVTQYNTITAPSSGSLKASSLAIWRNTLFYSASDEDGIVRYGKTVATFGNITSGNLHDFSDGNNFASAEGGAVTALWGAGDGQGNRIYIFQAKKVFFVGIEITSTGTEAFSPVRIFTPNYGCPNQHCVISMENVVVFWTGKRCIQIRFEPNTAQLVPDETFDEDIAEEFRTADDSQVISRLHYNETDKRVYITFQKNNLRTTAVRDNKRKKWAYPWDIDASVYVSRGKFSYIGDPDNDKIHKLGESLSFDGRDVTYRLFSGRIAGDNRKHKLFTKGRIEGKIREGTSVTFGSYVNSALHGGYRQISETTSDTLTTIGDSSTAGYAGMSATVGGGGTLDVGSGKKDFVYSFTVGKRGEDIAFSFSTLDDGSEWEINYAEIEYIEYDIRASKHY